MLIILPVVVAARFMLTEPYSEQVRSMHNQGCVGY